MYKTHQSIHFLRIKFDQNPKFQPDLMYYIYFLYYQLCAIVLYIYYILKNLRTLRNHSSEIVFKSNKYSSYFVWYKGLVMCYTYVYFYGILLCYKRNSEI